MKRINATQVIKGVILLFLGYIIVGFIMFVPINNYVNHLLTTVFLIVVWFVILILKVK